MPLTLFFLLLDIFACMVMLRQKISNWKYLLNRRLTNGIELFARGFQNKWATKKRLLNRRKII